MKQDNLCRFAPIVIFVALTALAGCGGSNRSETPSPALSTTQAPPAQSRLIAEEYAEGEATIQSIDHTNRTVTLRNPEGQVATVQAPADADLNRLKTGDRVRIGYYQSLSARVLPPGSAPLGATVATGSTAPGQAEGRAWGQQLTVVAEITAIDLAAHTVTLRGAQGKSRTITVKDPQMQQRMTNLKVGDLVELTYSGAIAAQVMRKS